MIDPDGRVVHEVELALPPHEVFDFLSRLAAAAAGQDPPSYPEEGTP